MYLDVGTGGLSPVNQAAGDNDVAKTETVRRGAIAEELNEFLVALGCSWRADSQY